MSDPWWTRDSADAEPLAGPADPSADILPTRAIAPLVVADGSEAARADVAGRIRSYTPEWTNFSRDDAGVALVRLFGTMVGPVRSRLNRLSEQAAIEHFDVAGIEPLPARAAEVDLQISLTPGAPRSIVVPAGFQVATAAADGGSARVVFETEWNLHAAPSAVEAVYREEQGRGVELDPERRWAPFGPEPRQGSALWIGLAGEVAPTGGLSLGFRAATDDGVPPPVLRGAGLSGIVSPPPLLSWELLDGGRLVTLEVRRDGTRSLQQSGIVDLRLPRSWIAARPSALPAPPSLRWLRVGLIHGVYSEPPMLDRVRINVVPAVAARTIRNEPLDRLDRRQDQDLGRVRMQLSQTPVLPGSVEIEVDAVAAEVFGTGAATGDPTRWDEIDELSSAGPADRVFTLDPSTGIVEFGDGVNGRSVPDGFRNVRAMQYRSGGGRAGNIEAEAGPTPLRSLPFVAGVDNPEPGTGGVDAEPQAEAVRRGPEELRARGRAVAPSDYGLLARRADGAEVARAYAVRGLHPDYVGAPIPGLVCVFVVPPIRDGARPIASPAALAAVADHLFTEAAPLGINVVTAPPRFHDVRVEARVQFVRGAELGAGIDTVLSRLNAYLDPLAGGEDGTGWNPGGSLLAVTTTRHLLALPEVRAIPQLNFVVDGVRYAPCADVPIAAHALVWPVGHEIVPIEPEIGA